jgi:putative ABC transport system substrate-binding protein
MVDVGFAQGVLEMGEVKATAHTLGLEVTPLEIRRAEDIAPAFEALNVQGNAQVTAPSDIAIDVRRVPARQIAVEVQQGSLDFGALTFHPPEVGLLEVPVRDV